MSELKTKLSAPFYMLLSMPSTAMGFALCVQISALSWIMDTQYGLDIHEIGYVWAAGPIAGIVGQLLVGIISDRVWFLGGRRRPFILIGGTIAALMLLLLPHLDKIQGLLGFSSVMGIAVVVALALDLAINVGFNPTRAIIADLTPEGKARTDGYTWMQTVSGFFGVLAYFIGSMWGNIELIYVGVGFVFIAAVVPMFFIREPKELAIEAKTVSSEPGRKTNEGAFFKIFIAHAFTWLGVQTMFVYTYAYIKFEIYPAPAELVNAATLTAAQEAALEPYQDEWGSIIAMAFLVLNLVGFIFPKFVLEPITQRIGRVRTHTVAIAIMAVAYFGMSQWATSATMLYAFMALAGIGWAATVSLPFAIFTERVSAAQMGLYMGVFNLSVVLPQLVASLNLGEYIEAATDKNLVYLISGASLAISAALWLLVKEKKTEADSE